MLCTSKTLALLGLVVFISPISHAFECLEAYTKALQSCKQPLSDQEFIALAPENTSYAEAHRVSERMLIKVQEKVFECGFALKDCSEICQHMGQIVERVGGYASRADEFFEKQTACEPGGELDAYFSALESTRQQSIALWQGAGHNADLVKALDFESERAPAQAPAQPLGPPIQVLPSTLDAPTNPEEYSRQVERALEYIK